MIRVKHAFTLAEVLITLVIIGVVAALTIPTLVAKINDKVNERQIQVAQKRLAESLKLYNTQEGAFNGKTYKSTYDFLNNGLSKYFKMTSICDTDHIGNCWPTETINYADDDGNIQTIKASELKTPEKLNLDNDGYYAPASFISGAGVPYIMVLKKGCIIDPDSRAEDADIWSCIDGLLDYQGTRQPNTLGKDVLPINVAGINAGPKPPTCLYSPNGVCMPIKAFYPSGAMGKFAANNCTALKNGEEVVDTDGLFGTAGEKVKVSTSFNFCPFAASSIYGDFWLAAKLKCESMGYRLPTEIELAKIAAAIYGYKGDVDSLNKDWSYNKTRGNNIATYGFHVHPNAVGTEINLWSDTERPQSYAYARVLNLSGTGPNVNCERNQGMKVEALCVAE